MSRGERGVGSAVAAARCKVGLARCPALRAPRSALRAGRLPCATRQTHLKVRLSGQGVAFRYGERAQREAERRAGFGAHKAHAALVHFAKGGHGGSQRLLRWHTANGCRAAIGRACRGGKGRREDRGRDGGGGEAVKPHAHENKTKRGWYPHLGEDGASVPAAPAGVAGAVVASELRWGNARVR